MIAYYLRNAFCGNISFQKMYGEYKAQGNIVQFWNENYKADI